MTIPGSHETMVGNNQKDGHSINFHNVHLLDGLIVLGNEKRFNELLNVSWVTKVIAVELFGSEDWGNVKFDWSWNENGETFISNYDLMYEYDNYEYMRTVSYIPLNLSAYWTALIRGTTCHWCNLIDMGAKQYNKKRCAKKAENGQTVVWVGLQNEIQPQTGMEAWNKLQEFTKASK